MMKNTIYITFALCAMALLSSSCNTASELPPIHEGYATSIILPDPTDLSAEEREYLEDLSKEYEEAIK